MARILVVEDEAFILALAESVIEEMGHKTLTAASREEALALFHGDDPIDLLFTDINLREEPNAGIELAREAVKLRPDLPVVYTTGYTVTDGMKAMFVERYVVMPKPYTVENIRDTIQAALKVTP